MRAKRWAQCLILAALSVACEISAQATEQPDPDENEALGSRVTYRPGVYAARPPFDRSATLPGTGGFDWARTSAGDDPGYMTPDEFDRAFVAPPLLQFLSPPAEAEIGAWQIFTLKFTINGLPFADMSGVVETDSDDIQLFPFLGFLQTDANGVARFMAKSDVEILSGATLSVTIDRAIAEHQIEFFSPNEDVSPHLGAFRMNSGNKAVDLRIDPLRIGLLAAADVEPRTVHEWAAALLLTVERRLDGNFFIINTGVPLTQNSRWWLARELKKIGGDVRSAGLLARHQGSRYPVVLDNRIYVRIKPDADIHAVLDGWLIDSTDPTEYGLNEFIVQSSHYDPLWFSRFLASKDPVIYAHPDVAQVIQQRSSSDGCDYSVQSWEPWCDFRYKKQWHLENIGQGGALIDADADVRKAWDYTLGSKQTLIAVIDTSFFLEQPDLEPNLWKDPDTGIRGFDLVDYDHSSLLFEWEVDFKTFRHGTSAAGLAAARYGPNSEGVGGDVVGVCPECTLLPIRVPLAEVTDDMKQAFWRASEHGADVISMSLGFSLIPENVTYDIDELVTKIDDTGQGAVLVFAMSNEEKENCGEVPDSASLESVIAVGGVTDYDAKSYQVNEAMGYGDCMDLVAPTRGGANGISTTNVVTNDSGQPVPHILDDFGGTSAATPQVAGSAALILDLKPPCQSPVLIQESVTCLTPLQVRMILQDTAEKVEQGNAHYSSETGFSDPPDPFTSTHGYGRINTFEAVKLVAPAENGGSDNRDLFVRDHQWDWGNTEQRSDIRFNVLSGSNPPEREIIDMLKSVDVKIDSGRDSGFDSAYSLHSFNDLVHEDPEPDTAFDIYVRLRNRGQANVSSAKLLVHWAVFEDQLPDLDFNVWEESTATDSDKTRWHTLAPESVNDVPYSGASVAGCFQGAWVPGCPGGTGVHVDRAQVLVFEVLGGISWEPTSEHLALLVAVDSDEDMVQARRASPPPGLIESSAISQVVWDNNVTLWTKKQPAAANPSDSIVNPGDSGNPTETHPENDEGRQNGPENSGQNCSESGGCESVCGGMPYWVCWLIGIALILIVIAVVWWGVKAWGTQ